MILKKLMSPFTYIYHGFLIVIKTIGNFFKYVFLGILAFPTMLVYLFTKKNINHKNTIEIKKTNNSYKKTDILLAEHQREKAKNEEKEEKTRQLEQRLREKKAQKNLNEFIQDSSKLEYKNAREKIDKKGNKRSSFSDKIKNIFNTNLGTGGHIKDKYKDAVEMSINYEGPDAEKNKNKMTYEYIARNLNGQVIKGYFAAYSLVEVHSFLKSQGYKVYSIKTSKWINVMYGNVGGSHDKFKTSDLIFFLAQVSTYLKVGIPLAEAIRILEKQFKNKKYKRILSTLHYDLTTGKSFSEAMTKQENAFPNLLINMVKTAEMTGELPEILDDMEEYYTEIEETRKAMVTAMMYPAIIFVIAIGVGTFIMLYVVPKFIEVYETMDNATIPGITLAVLALSEFLQKYIIYIGICAIVILIICIYLYKNVKVFRKNVQRLLMHLPVFGDVIIYKEVTTFTKTFSSLLSHNVFITDSMEILNKVTNNEIYKELIYDAIDNIAQGKAISSAFQDQWAFPVPAYEMIVTGERTGQLPEMMHKISLYYQDLHKNSVARIKTFVEPALIVLLTVMVGIIVLSIVVPMFSMYSQIQA